MITHAAGWWVWLPASVMACTAAGAQPGGDAPASRTPPPAPAAQSEVPPGLRLGARVSAVQARIPVAPVVVVVPDERSYVAAIGAWSLAARFPVLIDDGSSESAAAVSRFVRAFRGGGRNGVAEKGEAGGAEDAVRVVLWKTDGAGEPLKDGEVVRGAVEGALASAWGFGAAGEARGAPKITPERLEAHWKQLKFVPPGVVVACASDPAWTAALALAAGRGQPIIWADQWCGGSPGDLGAPMGTERIDALSAMIERELGEQQAAHGWAWAAPGDDIEAVTLCLNCPARVMLAEGDTRAALATTDVVGRALAPKPGVIGGREVRWAWSGQVVGTAPAAAYSAMSALFLTPSRAWLFDSYETTEPWIRYDATAAAVNFEKIGISTTVDDDQRGGSLRDWRTRLAGGESGGGAAPKGGRGVSADVIAVMTSGQFNVFDLKPGQARAGDVPWLHRPALVYFVHSWSAAFLADPECIARRWLDRGAFAYIGSIHEPLLSGFVPTPAWVGRMATGYPLGAAARYDDGDAWKIVVLGDPLHTWSNSLVQQGRAEAAPRAAAEVPLAGAADAESALAEALKAGEFARGLRLLAMLGRDDDAAALLAALMKDDAAKVTGPTALAGLGSAFMSGDRGLFVRTYAAALPEIERIGGAEGERWKDVLWHAAWAWGVKGEPAINAEERGLLKRSIRTGLKERDGFEAGKE